MNSTNYPSSLIFNAWASFLTPYAQVECSMSCYVNRLLLLLAFLNNKVPDISVNDDILYLSRNIHNTAWIINSETETIILSSNNEYFQKWIQLNKSAVHIIKFLFSNMRNIPEESQEHFENIMEFFELSLLQCKVPLRYLFKLENKENIVHHFLRANFQTVFRKASRNSDFFEFNYPYTVGCFKMSITNMFRDLTKLNKNCEPELYNFYTLIKQKNIDDVSQNLPLNAEFGKYVLYLDKVGADTLKNFNDCIDNVTYKNDNDFALHRAAYANILSRFYNFYEVCGAPPIMMDAHWNEMYSRNND